MDDIDILKEHLRCAEANLAATTASYKGRRKSEKRGPETVKEQLTRLENDVERAKLAVAAVAETRRIVAAAAAQQGDAGGQERRK